ncbi:hypothetical protein F5888DRAFT_1639150 [Russula emetica]|nr:hypothetical protein F5888DRAFT_1639150 [Russula emetica]
MWRWHILLLQFLQSCLLIRSLNTSELYRGKRFHPNCAGTQLPVTWGPPQRSSTTGTPPRPRDAAQRTSSQILFYATVQLGAWVTTSEPLESGAGADSGSDISEDEACGDLKLMTHWRGALIFFSVEVNGEHSYIPVYHQSRAGSTALSPVASAASPKQ